MRVDPNWSLSLEKICLPLVIAAVLQLTSCKIPRLIDSSLVIQPNVRKIIGTDESVPIDSGRTNIPERYRLVTDSVGLFNNNCTATYIGNNLAITAGHCLLPDKGFIKNQDCGGKRVVWGKRHDTRGYGESICTEILYARLDHQTLAVGVDVAVIKVDKPARYAARVDYEGSGTGTTISIFGHPNARPLTWSDECKIEEMLETKATYLCDTQGGSSGASVISKNNLMVVGVHNGALENANYSTDNGSIDWNEISEVAQLCGLDDKCASEKFIGNDGKEINGFEIRGSSGDADPGSDSSINVSEDLPADLEEKIFLSIDISNIEKESKRRLIVSASGNIDEVLLCKGGLESCWKSREKVAQFNSVRGEDSSATPLFRSDAGADLESGDYALFGFYEGKVEFAKELAITKK